MTIDESIATKLEDLSGWLFPDGTWCACEDWWHIPALYDLRDTNNSYLSSEETGFILKSGDEEKIRNHIAKIGILRISRKMIDGYELNFPQLKMLQELLEYCDANSELSILCTKDGNDIINQNKNITVARLLKLKKPAFFFNTENL